MKVLVIGGSRNIGYFSAVRFLKSGEIVTFLLRTPSVFDKDEVIQEFVKSGKARLVKGDALVKEDCKKAWEEAAKGEPDSEGVDLLVFTVGGTPTFQLTKGFVISPANLVTQSLLNTLSTMPSHKTKIITISVSGVTKKSHASLPFLLKQIYTYLIAVPHKDKLCAERVVAHLSDWPWDAKDGEPGEDMMGEGDWRKKEGLPEKGELKDMVVVIRPSLLTDGECRAEKDIKGKAPYRATEGDVEKGWTISRKDVSHFLVEGVVKNWNEWKGKYVAIAY